MSSCLNWLNGSDPYDRIMSYTRWNALRDTDGLSATRSRYSQNDPSQCCSRKREVSSLRSRIPTNGFDAIVLAMVHISNLHHAHVCVRGSHTLLIMTRVTPGRWNFTKSDTT